MKIFFNMVVWKLSILAYIRHQVVSFLIFNKFPMTQTLTIKKGMFILYKDEPHVILEANFSKQGRVSAFTRTRLKSLISGKVIAETFKSGEKVEEIDVSTKTMQYVYQDGSNAYVMDKESFAQYPVSLELVSDVLPFVKEGDDVVVQFYEDDPIALNARPKVTLVVTETMDAVRGNTSSNAFKSATLETGKVLEVPLFIKEGDAIIVNTENGQYVSKA